VFFSILDHHSRRPAAAPSTNKVMGCIMGTVSKDGVVEITNRWAALDFARAGMRF
jgi:hypothetical protein